MWQVDYMVSDSRDPFTPLKRGKTEGPHLAALIAHLSSTLDLAQVAVDLKPMTMTDAEMCVLYVIRLTR